MWLLRSAPLRPRDLLRAKLLSTLPPLVLVAVAMALVSSWILGVAPSLVALAAVEAALTAIASASIATGLGAVLPDYRAENPAKVAAGFGGLVSMTVSVLHAFALVALFAYPAWALERGLPGRLGGAVACLAGALLLAGAGVAVPLLLGTRALERQAS